MTLENSYSAMLIKEKKASAQADTLFKLPENYIALYDKSIFNYLLAHDKDLAKTFNNLGVCGAKTGQYIEAIDYLNQALAIDPAFREALNNKKIIETMIKTP
jgi:tetratricopeptide (TPR) repeat protein